MFCLAPSETKKPKLAGVGCLFLSSPVIETSDCDGGPSVAFECGKLPRTGNPSPVNSTTDRSAAPFLMKRFPIERGLGPWCDAGVFMILSDVTSLMRRDYRGIDLEHGSQGHGSYSAQSAGLSSTKSENNLRRAFG